MPPTVSNYWADPTLKQLGFIWQLTVSRKKKLKMPRNRIEASRMIETLLAMKPAPKKPLAQGFAIEYSGDGQIFDRANGRRRAISRAEARRIQSRD